MKKAGKFFALIAILFAVSVSFNASGQKKGHNKRDKDSRNGRDNRDHEKHGQDYYSRGHDRHRHERRQVRHVHQHRHDRYCRHSPVVVHHYTRPRYIYYRDYDVYYDSRNSVYISYSGRSWTVSAGIPFAMRHINVRNAARFEVDPDSYRDQDDFPRYLKTRRPTYSRVYRDW